ncbi:MAG: hypothetical protein K2L04_01565 [Alistipes sp.]|nr:hypothetical protein [Alistipes sp.]
MKKISILLLNLLLSTWCFGSLYYDGPDQSSKTKVELSVDSKPNFRPRSMQPEPAITAELFADQLFFYFDDPVGEVAITVTDSFGQVVSAATCNSDFEPMVVLSVPTDAGFYRIDLEGAFLKGYGEYSRN